MSNINTQATVNLTINGQQPIQVLQQLRQNAMQLEAAIARAAAAGNRTDLRRLRRQLTDTRKQIREIESSTMQVESVMRRLNRATPNELNRSLQTLTRQLNYIERGSAAWNAHVAKIRMVKAEIAKLNMEMRAHESFWKRFTRTMNDWQASIFMTAAVLSGFIMAGRRAVNAFAEMEEQMANTRKYTRMTTEQVQELNEAFKKMDTRTSRDKLNEFAQEAGRLGKHTMEDVKGYVEAADILSVALVDLGEGATQTIAKISNIFGVEQLLGTKEAMLSVGSTVNVLSQNCTASKPYLVEFAQRLAGVGAQAHMTIPEILAFGATLDANGQKVEMAASALSRTIMKIYQKPQEIAKAVGLDVQKFTETLKVSTNEGLLMFLERLHQIGDKDALAALSPLFKDLGMDGIRMAQVLSVLSGKLEMVRWEQQEANKAFEQATSATREYDIFNNTAQAGIDKAKKRIHELAVELGQKLLPLYRHLMTSGSAMLRLLNMIVSFIIKHKTAILTLTAAILAYNVVVKAEVMLTTLSNAAHKTKALLIRGITLLLSPLTAAYHLCAAGIANMTGNTMRARTEMMAFNAVCAANPIGAVVTALVAAVAAFSAFSDSASEAEEETNSLTQATNDAIQSREREKMILSENIKKLQAFNGDRREEQRLVTELNKKYGPILGTYKSIAEWLSVLKRRGDEWCNTVYRQMVVEAKLEYARQLIAKATAEREKMGQYSPSDWEVFCRMTQDWTLDAYNVFGGDGGEWTGWDRAKGELQYEIDKKFEDNAIALENQAQKIIEEAQSEAEAIHYQIQGVVGDVTVPDDPEPPSFTPVNEKAERAAAAADKRRQHQADVEERRRRAEEEKQRRIAETLQKKEFKDALDKAKEHLYTQNAEALKAYNNDEIDYVAYLDRKQDALIAFYEECEEVYKKFEAEDSKEVAKLRQDKEEAEKKYEKERIRMITEHYAEERDAERTAAQMEFYNADNLKAYKNQRMLDDKLAEIDLQYHRNVLEAQKQGSKEFEQAWVALKKAEREEELRQRMKMEEDLNAWLFVYSQKGAKERMDAELAIVDELHKQEKLSAEEVEEAKNAIRKKYRDEINERTGTTAPNQEFEDAKDEYKNQLAALEDYKNQELITEEEYDARKYQIEKNYHDKILELIDGEEDNWGKMLATLIETWQKGFENLGSTLPEKLKAIAAMAESAFAIMGAGIQSLSDYNSAAQELEEAKVERLAKKEVITEEQKEKRLKAIKDKYNKRAQAIEISQAIASTALAAINAYASAAKIPVIGYIIAPVAAGMALAAGAVQIATIKKQHEAQAVGYAEGGFTKPGAKDEVAGVVHAGEWVASQRLLASPVARPLIEALDYAQRTNTIGSLRGSDVSRSITAQHFLAQSQPQVIIQENAELRETIKQLKERLDEPFVTVNTVTGDLGIKQAQDSYQRLMNNKSPKNKRK